VPGSVSSLEGKGKIDVCQLLHPQRGSQQVPTPPACAFMLANKSPSRTVWALFKLLLLHLVLGPMSVHMSPLKAKILYSLYICGSPGCRRFGWLLSGFQVLKVA
jgi:hypothetical protein